MREEESEKVSGSELAYLEAINVKSKASRSLKQLLLRNFFFTVFTCFKMNVIFSVFLQLGV